MQLNLRIATKEQIKHSWAFAVGPSYIRRRRNSLKDLNRCIITSCSKEAKTLGIRAGMRYEEARQRLPELKIFVYGVNHGRR